MLVLVLCCPFQSIRSFISVKCDACVVRLFLKRLKLDISSVWAVYNFSSGRYFCLMFLYFELTMLSTRFYGILCQSRQT